ncbi:glycosyltransferase family 4 protein [Kiloniella sp.]|uniref:glycosyltransferase family 4 protein n=1 Tax=Kiloniella sp. TaxID=1938587 RepID=UPI003A8DB2B7
MSNISNDRKKTLTYISFEPLRQGHASYTHVIEIINGLKEQEWVVNLIAPEYKSTHLPGIITRLFSFLKLWLRLLFSPKTDIIYTRMHFAGFIVSLIAKLKHIPIAVEVNGPFEDLYIAWPSVKKFRFIFDGLMRKQMQLASVIISVTPGLEQYSEKKLSCYKKKPFFEVVTNGANTSIFMPKNQLPPKSNLFTKANEKPYAAFYGTFAKWQGLDNLLNAATSPFWPPDLELRLAGDGVMRPLVEEAAEKNKHIGYLGRINYQDMPYFVSESKLSFVLTQDTDGRGQFGLYPLKLFEAMAAGVPVITTRLPGQKDIVINNDCGIVIPNSSPETLCEAVTSIHKNQSRAKKYGWNGRQAAEELYSWKQLAKRTDTILQKLL